MAVRTKLVDTVAGKHDGNRFGLLLAVLVGSYLASAFLSGDWIRTLQVAVFLVVVLIALRTEPFSRRAGRLARLAVLAGSLIIVVLTRVSKSDPATGAAFLWGALLLLFAAVLIIRRVLTQSEITLQSIYGAISAYMIIGLMFAAFYGAVSKLGSGPFFANGQPATVATFQYFSFATLTTVGYGDFTAAAANGRAVAVMEALLGQIFLATLVARLVSAYRSPRFAKGDAGPGGEDGGKEGGKGGGEDEADDDRPAEAGDD